MHGSLRQVWVMMVCALALGFGSSGFMADDRDHGSHHGPFFEPIGDLPGDCFLSIATDVSADGERVSCISGADDPAVPNDGGTCFDFLYSHSNEAALWTRPSERGRFSASSGPSGNGSGGLVGLGYLPGSGAAHAESYSYGISPDGDWIVGYSNIEADNRTRAVVFLHGTIQPLAMLDLISVATDVSGARKGPGEGGDRNNDDARRIDRDGFEGRIVVGYTSTSNQEPLKSPGARAVYWDSWTHVVVLPTPGLLRNNMAVISSEAVGVSSDGTTIVGNLYYNQPLNPSHFMSMACVWSRQGDQYLLRSVLDDLPGGDDEARATNISGDGKVIVGWGNSASGNPACWDYPTTACVWRLERDGGSPGHWGTPTAFAPLAGFAFSTAGGTNDDGSVVVGTAQNVVGTCDEPEFQDEAVVWDGRQPGTSPRDIALVLGAAVPARWNVAIASRVSRDGRTIVGYGFNPDFDIEGWVARIP